MTAPIGASPALPLEAPPQSQTDLGIEGAANAAAQAGASRSPADERVAMSGPLVTAGRSAPAAEDRLSRLQALLISLGEKKREIQQSIGKLRSELLELELAINEVRSAIANDRPITASVMSTLGVLGIVAAIGGFPVIAWAAGVFGAIFGLSDSYKSKANQALAQLEAKIGEKQLQIEQLQSDADKLDRQIATAEGSIEREKARLQQEARERTVSSKAIVKDPGWEAFPEQGTRIYLAQGSNDRR